MQRISLGHNQRLHVGRDRLRDILAELAFELLARHDDITSPDLLSLFNVICPHSVSTEGGNLATLRAATPVEVAVQW